MGSTYNYLDINEQGNNERSVTGHVCILSLSNNRCEVWKVVLLFIRTIIIFLCRSTLEPCQMTCVHHWDRGMGISQTIACLQPTVSVAIIVPV